MPSCRSRAMQGRMLAACGCMWLLVPPALAAATLPVPPGGDLQQAINTAQAGDTIALQPGATYVGNFVLPDKAGSAAITIRTAGDTGLPGGGSRINPSYAPLLAKIASPNASPAVQTAP